MASTQTEVVNGRPYFLLRFWHQRFAIENHRGVKDVAGFPALYRSLGVLQNIEYVVAPSVGGCLRINGVLRFALPMVTSNLNAPQIMLRIEWVRHPELFPLEVLYLVNGHKLAVLAYEP
jgi:hypothetical protein